MTRTVRFRFKTPNRELPLTVGGLPDVQPRLGRDGKPLSNEVVMDTPIGSGPLQNRPVRFGKDITYVRDAALLGAEICRCAGVRSTLTASAIKIYKDNTARLEALKAGRV